MKSLVRLALAAGLVAGLLASALPAGAQGYRLAPFKDELFAYRGILEDRDGGDYLVVAYDKMIDIHQRDEQPEVKVRAPYVTQPWSMKQKNLTYEANGKTLKYVAVGGDFQKPKAIVIFLHGKNVDRLLGVNDWKFGGNFNRLKNLMVRNGGLYLSPDFSDFEQRGASEIKTLLLAYARMAPGTPIFLACGSMGGAICWALSKDSDAAPHLAGLLLLGSTHDDDFLRTQAVAGAGPRIPLYLGHGGGDTVFDWKEQAAFYSRVRAAAPGYPVKFVLFDTGSHGTPIRMTDWRQVLNWMLAAGGR